MDRFVTKSPSDSQGRSRSVSGDSFRSQTPMSVSGPSAMEHMPDQESDFDLSLPDTQPLTQEEAGDQDNSNQPAVRELKNYLETLDR